LLGVRGRWVLVNLTTIARGDIRAAAGSVDQGRGRLFLFVIIVDDSNKSVALGCSAF